MLGGDNGYRRSWQENVLLYEYQSPPGQICISRFVLRALKRSAILSHYDTCPQRDG